MMASYTYDGVTVSFNVIEGAPGRDKWHVYYEIEKHVNEESIIYCSKDYYGADLEDVNKRMRNELASFLDGINNAFSKAVRDMYWTEGPGAWVPM